MAAEAAVGGFVVTSGRITREAEAFAAGRNIQLIDGGTLKWWIAQHKSEQGRVAPAAAASEKNPAPTCPKCSASMIKRTATRGANAGKVFWGCSGYPRCRAIVNI